MVTRLRTLCVDVYFISTDTPEQSRRLRAKLAVTPPIRFLADVDHAVADQYGVAIGRRHPKAWSYQDGFAQPAVFGFRGETPLYRFIQEPRLLNLWGAARRPEPADILAEMEPGLRGAPAEGEPSDGEPSAEPDAS